MASLWSMFRHRKYRQFEYHADVTTRAAEIVSKLLKDHPPVLVNITDYLVEVVLAADPIRLESADMTPCHRSLWLEWMHPQSRQRQAVHVFREDSYRVPWADKFQLPDMAGVRFVLVISTWAEHEGMVRLYTISHIFINEHGAPLPGERPYYGPLEAKHQAVAHITLAAEVLTTMNTKGTRMEPPIPSAPVQIIKPDRWACSVWHTIHIPKFPRPHQPLGCDVTPEMLERREHMVRAHRADYRNGKGLFGRIHGLVWVPEHKRGNPELGTVKQTFEVGSR